MTRIRRPFEVDWANARITVTRSPATTALDELLASLPDASGEFTGYLIPPMWAESFGFRPEPLDSNYFDFRDACSPDVSEPYPF